MKKKNEPDARIVISLNKVITPNGKKVMARMFTDGELSCSAESNGIMQCDSDIFDMAMDALSVLSKKVQDISEEEDKIIPTEEDDEQEYEDWDFSGDDDQEEDFISSLLDLDDEDEEDDFVPAKDKSKRNLPYHVYEEMVEAGYYEKHKDLFLHDFITGKFIIQVDMEDWRFFAGYMKRQRIDWVIGKPVTRDFPGDGDMDTVYIKYQKRMDETQGIIWSGDVRIFRDDIKIIRWKFYTTI